jgi:hypothetical protein
MQGLRQYDALEGCRHERIALAQVSYDGRGGVPLVDVKPVTPHCAGPEAPGVVGPTDLEDITRDDVRPASEEPLDVPAVDRLPSVEAKPVAERAASAKVPPAGRMGPPGCWSDNSPQELP